MLLINKQLLKLAKNSWGWIIAIVVTKLIILLSFMVVVSAVSRLIGSFVGEGNANIGSQILIALISAVIGLAGNLILGEVKFKCTADIRIRLRHDIYQKMLDLEMDYLVKMGTSRAVTASIDGIEALEKYFSEYLPDLIYCFIAPFILFARIYSYSAYAAWVLLVLSLTVIPANAVFKKLMAMLRKDYWDTFDKLNEYFLESLEGMTTLKLMNRDMDRAENLKTRSFNYYHMIVKTMRVSFYSTILTQSFIYGGILWSTFILIGSCSKGMIALSAAFYALMLAFTFFRPVQDLINTGHTALNGVAAAGNIFTFLDLVPARAPVDVSLPEAEDKDGIVLENVVFSYDGKRNAVDGVSIRVPRGKTVALVGQSGCGKSTLVNLVMHFNDCASGRISLEGKDLRSITQEDLRRRISLVPQSTYIFSGTVEDNLRIVDKSLSRERMLEVLKDVHLEDLIAKDGLATDVGEGGSKLSGGQKQKIGIARALLSDADYIVFDEATSNVDAVNEEDIWNCIHTLSNTKTLLIISHRLSTVRNADTIYVMREGKVAESGDHGKLIAEAGIYAQLVREQDVLENYGRRAV
ncbi:MAG: ATP-binding cassette domain-containing protein [Oscillospiraceae bacterium]|nr:ATP-binding cassette domain-containing protein [Oscillospiraceae bacterium]